MLNLEAIPPELKLRHQWVLWEKVKRGEKFTKVLKNARTGKQAESDNPATWSSFEEAIEGLEVFEEYDGIGYVFSADDPYVGIDLDSCVDENGEILRWARDVLDEIDSYAERSPSGRGVHMLARGSLPGKGRHKGPLEIYDQVRFFTITGDHIWDTPKEIHERQERIDDFLERNFPPPSLNGAATVQPVDVNDADLIDKARRCNARFDRLWRGDWSEYESASEGDLALCSHLAWWTGNDTHRMERLFGQSGLVRPKWTSRQDYRERTIAKAIEGVTDTYSPSRNGTRPEGAFVPAVEEPDPEVENQPPEFAARLLTFSQLLQQPGLSWVLDGVIQDESVLMIYGPTNEGKTFIGASLCHAVRTGDSWCGRGVSRAGPVLYVNAEYGAEFGERARAWETQHRLAGLAPPDHEFYTFPDPIHLHDPQEMYKLYRLLEWLDPTPALVVFDTYSQCIPGVDENDQAAGSLIVMGLRRICREFSATAAVIHHTNATGQRERGSTVLPNAAHTHIRVDMDRATKLITATCKKQRGGERFDPITFRLEPVPGTNEVWPLWIPDRGPVLTGQQVAREERLGSIVGFIREYPGSLTESVQSAFDLSEGTCRNDLEELVSRKLIFGHKRVRQPGDKGRAPMSWYPEGSQDE